MHGKITGEWLKRELKRYLAIAGYLYVCFIAALLYKAAILRDFGIDYTPYWFAGVKALIFAKFIMVGEGLGLGSGLRKISPVYAVLCRSAAFLILLVGLSAAETLVEGVLHHKTVAQSFADFGGGTVAELLATCFLVFLVLLPYFAYRHLDEALGKGKISQLMLTHFGRD